MCGLGSCTVGLGELVKLCQEELGWKKSTTYTIVRKMCEKGYIANENATITVLIPKAQAQGGITVFY